MPHPCVAASPEGKGMYVWYVCMVCMYGMYVWYVCSVCMYKDRGREIGKKCPKNYVTPIGAN